MFFRIKRVTSVEIGERREDGHGFRWVYTNGREGKTDTSCIIAFKFPLRVKDIRCKAGEEGRRRGNE